MPLLHPLLVALFVPRLCAGDDTGLIQESLAPSANSGFFDLVAFHTGRAEQKPMREILGLVGAHARNLSDAGRRPSLVHIGANLFDNDVRWADMHLYGEVQRALSLAGVPLHAYSLHLVEPRNATYPTLMARMNDLGLTGEKDVDITQALIMGSCPGPTVTMYGPSEIMKQLPDNCGGYMNVDSWSSMNPKQFANIVHGVRESRWEDFHWIRWATNICIADQIIALEPDESKWTEAREVKCMSSSETLTSMGANAADVAMLAVDAEGADIGIVSEFLKLETFAPALIQFESMWENLKDNPLLQTLQSRGYAVGTLTPGLVPADADNVYAVRLSGPGGQ